MASRNQPPDSSTTPTNPRPGATTTTTVTPTNRRAMSADVPSSTRTGRRQSLHTPTISLARLTVNSSSAPRTATQSTRRTPRHLHPPSVRTPHGRAALRLIDQRRAAALTPGRARRRKSLRDARETPRDVLRNLSRVLATKSKPVKSSSPASLAREDESEDIDMHDLHDGYDSYDDIPIDRPRLSLPIDQGSHSDGDDDDSSILVPPQSSGLGLDDDAMNYTAQSIELGRRAVSEQPFRRESLGSFRMSDYFNPEDGFDPFGRGGMAAMGTPDVGIDSGFFPPEGIDPEFPQSSPTAAGHGLGGDAYSGIELDADAGTRESDIGLGGGGGGGSGGGTVDPNESTVMIAAQARDSPSRLPDIVEEDHGQEEASDGPENEPFGFDYDNDNDDDDDLGAAGPASDSDLPPAGAGETEALSVAEAAGAAKSTKKGIKLSAHGIPYPSLPPATIKRLATTLAAQSGAGGKVKLSPDTLAEISKASDWFFQQLGDDLGAYAKHAGRKTIDEHDMITLMKRQRQITSSKTLFSLAQRHLPRELLQELRMPAPVQPKPKRRPTTVRRAST
ncbi:Centromere protein T [Zalerion maritima]|uniref:Centromere protein T n=1 Tax=Zalerion maritima TaxID=339359 RepID=A0AAD5RIH0_9PEZI|nr:Centromere protein T [Zalerion maritima]